MVCLSEELKNSWLDFMRRCGKGTVVLKERNSDTLPILSLQEMTDNTYLFNILISG